LWNKIIEVSLLLLASFAEYQAISNAQTM